MVRGCACGLSVRCTRQHSARSAQDDLRKDKIAVENLYAHIKALKARVERIKKEKQLAQLEVRKHAASCGRHPATVCAPLVCAPLVCAALVRWISRAMHTWAPSGCRGAQAQFHQYSAAASKMEGQVEELQDVRSALQDKISSMQSLITPLRQKEDQVSTCA